MISDQSNYYARKAYRTLRIYCIHSGGFWSRGVFRLYLPKAQRVWTKPGIYVRDHSAHSHKNSAEIVPGVAPTGAKTCLFLSPIQRGLSAAYYAPILTAFEIKDVNRCSHA